MARLEQLKARADKILKVKDSESKLKDATNELLRLTVPEHWNSHVKGNAEVRTEREYDTLLFMVGEHTKEELDSITIKMFFSLIDYIKSKHKNG